MLRLGWGGVASSLNNKDWCKGGLNQKLILYMHAFVWRCHLPVTTDLKSELGKLKGRGNAPPELIPPG